MEDNQVIDPESPPKQSVAEFAASVRAKYPVYANMKDDELVNNIVAKYPVYKDQIDFGGKKKSDGGSVEATPENSPNLFIHSPSSSGAGNGTSMLEHGASSLEDLTEDQHPELKAAPPKEDGNNTLFGDGTVLGLDPEQQPGPGGAGDKALAMGSVIAGKIDGAFAVIPKSLGFLSQVGDNIYNTSLPKELLAAHPELKQGIITKGLNWAADYLTSLGDSVKLPDNFVGNTVQGLADAAPLVAGGEAFKGAQLAADGSELAGNYLSKLDIFQRALTEAAGPVTKYMATTGALSGASDAYKANDGDFLPTVEGGVKGFNEGVTGGATLEMQMAAGGQIGSKLFNKMVSSGLATEDGKLTEAAMKSFIGSPTAFAAGSVAGDLAAGRPVDWNNAGVSAATALAFEAPHVADAYGAERDIQEAKDGLDQNINKVIAARDNNALVNFSTAHPTEIIDAMHLPDSPQDLQVQALQKGAEAQQADTYKEKNTLHSEQIDLQNQADIKRIGQMIIDNGYPEFEKAVNDSALPDDAKQALLVNGSGVNKAFNPIETEKSDTNQDIKTLNDHIQVTQAAISSTSDQGEIADHYVKLNDLIGQRVQAQMKLFDLSTGPDGVNEAGSQKPEAGSENNGTPSPAAAETGGELTAEQQAQVDGLERQRQAAHDNIQENVFNEHSHYVPGTDFKGNNAESVHKQIDTHFDREVAEAGSRKPEAESREETDRATPLATAVETAVKPYAISNEHVGDAHIIGVKDNGDITLKMEDGHIEDVPKEDHSVLGISNGDVAAFRQENGIKAAVPETLDDRIQDLSERINAGKTDFSHEDMQLHQLYPEKVEEAVREVGSRKSEVGSQEEGVTGQVPPSATEVATGGDVAPDAAVVREALRAQLEPDYKNTIVDKLNSFAERVKGKKYPTVLEFVEKVLPRKYALAYKNLYEMAARNGLKVNIEPGVLGHRGFAASWGMGAINFDPHIAKMSLDNWEDFTHTLNHEIIHGLLDRGINSNAFDLHTELAPIFERVKAAAGKASAHVRDILSYIEESGRDLPKITDTKNIDYEKEDAEKNAPKTNDLEELITYAFTDKKFANFLNSLPSENKEGPGRHTIFTELKETIRKFIMKLSGKSALDDIERAVNKYFDTGWNEKQYAERNKLYWNQDMELREHAFDKYQNDPFQIAEAYTSAKANGSDPGLVNAVEGGEMRGIKAKGASDQERPVREPGESLRDYTQRIRDFIEEQKKVAGGSGSGSTAEAGSPKPVLPPEEHAAPNWELEPETRTEKFNRTWQDYLNRMATVQRAIEQAGGTISDRTDYHTAADLQGARASQKVNELYEQMVKSPEKDNPAFFERLNKEGLEKDDLDKFLRAVHVEEYNKVVGDRRRAAYEAELKRLEKNRQQAVDEGRPQKERYYEKAIKDMQDQKNERYPLMDDGGSGMTNAEAKEILDRYKDEGKFDLLKKYGDEFVKEVSNKQLDVQLASGTIDQDTYDKLKEQFKNYVPFNVESFLEPKDENDQPIKKNSVKKLSSVDNIIRRAKGSADRKAEERVSPSTYGIVQLEKAHIEGEVNKTSNILYNLVEQNPNDSVFEIVHPRYMPERRGDGTVSHFREITDPKVVRDSIQLYRDGRKAYIHIKDPILRRAISRQGIVKTIGFLDHINNYFRAVSTVLSPEFWVTNSLKHVQLGVYNLSTDGKKDIAWSMAKNSLPAMKAVFDYQHGRRDGEWAPWVERYLQSGGKLAGIAPATDIEKVKSIEKLVDDIGKKKNIVQNTKAFIHYVSSFGDASGVGPRLAMFRAAAEKGLSDQQAAALSREATINFNKKGEWSGIAGNFYLMFNAGAQGKIYMAKKLLASPAARKVYGGMFIAGVMQAAMNAAFSKPDDEPVAEYEKQNNFILKNPFGGGDIKLPIGFGLNVPYYMGVKMYEVMSGQAKPGAASMGVLANTLTSFSPVAHNDLVQMITPTEPLRSAVQYVENKNTFGEPIYKDPDKFGVAQPSSHVHFASTQPEFVSLAQGLNKVTGGTGVKSGMVDLSPDAMQWLYNTATGGLGTTVQDAGHTVAHFGEEAYQKAGFMPADAQLTPLEIRQVPLLRKFYTEGTPVNYKSIIFQTLQKSGNHEISGPETTDFFQALMSAAVKGQITMKQYKQYQDEFKDNVIRVQVGNALPDEERNVIDKVDKRKR